MQRILTTVRFMVAAFLAVTSASPGRCEEPYTNRLVDSNNPYLLLHAHNPVDWYPWGPAAFDKARRENKPIFLSIGYSTCYWCHVAERTLFSDPHIAKMMNEWFVNVKVDREERPDVDSIYLLATQLITGGAGGWPNNLFLTPGLAPFYAGGYFPPEDDDVGHPGFPGILKSIHEQWEEQPDRLRERAQGFVTVLRQYQSKAIAGTAPIDPGAWREKTRAAIFKRFDEEHGGLSAGRQATKFPESPVLEFMLSEYRSRRDAQTLRFLTVTLDAMAYGGIYDQLGGGFHRYSIERTWSLPHFEKMLYDNAQLLSIYAQAWELTGRARYRRIAMGVRTYLRAQMMSRSGGFYTAQDAAVEGREGTSYLWTRKQIAESLGQDATAFLETYALTTLESEDPTLEIDDKPGVLRVRLEGSAEEREARLVRLEPARRKLLAARELRAQPAVDQKILTGLNGLTVDALVTSARLLHERDDLEIAARTADRLWSAAWIRNSARLHHGLYGSHAQGEGFIDDYAFLIRGLLALHQATHSDRWLVRARTLGDALVRRFVEEGSGALRSTADDESLIFAPIEEGDGAYPAGLSAAVDALSRLSIATGSARFARVATGIAGRGAAQPDRWPTLVAAVNAVPAALMTAMAQKPERAASAAHDTAAHLRASATVRSTSEHDEIAVTLQIAPGYHINANPASYDYLIPTTLRLPRLPAAQMRYPPGTLLKAQFAPEGIRVYSDTVELVAQLAKGALAHAAALRVTVDAQACTDSVCLPPSQIPLILRMGR